ncbi:ParB/RepB/Spo0J family partition protein [Sphingobium sp. DEHP117]|uniref:ParB/RepB/Spo0J family partition protein n=1 Tax=Sphingobium sp. DEHP117 TaxID=2993436 RepID=UPI0027D60ACF|nr:ParB/RepB/Spo0J family partition protein [Sphingobium sp. DEHP117]MDQ4422114.1 ParB/RepB/Spo0J family partition protein [Sphingobium sp. DEHP117]
MARKQSDYLAGLLADETPASADDTPALPLREDEFPSRSTQPRPANRAGLSLLGRESALARVASGEVKQVTQLQLDPCRVRLWAGNARMQTRLSEATVRDLIDSIVAEGGQKVPVVVRHVSDDPVHDYEVIVGTRRHFAISWLRANSYPDMKLLAQVADLDDEAAFRLADVENRARKDVSDIERARNYAAALEAHYGGKAIRMAERLKVSKGWLSKMLKAAAIPDDVLAAFANLGELPLNPAYALATALDDPARAEAIREEASVIVNENEGAQSDDSPPMPGSAVLKRLMSATTARLNATKTFDMQVQGRFGRPILTLKTVTRQGVTLHLPTGAGADDKQLQEALQAILDMLRENGVSLT